MQKSFPMVQTASLPENSDSRRISQLVTNVERPKRLERFEPLELFERLSGLPSPLEFANARERLFDCTAESINDKFPTWELGKSGAGAWRDWSES